MPFDKEKAATYLQSDDFKKLNSSDQQAVIARMRELAKVTDTPAPKPKAAERPGAFTRILRGVGLPSSMDELRAMVPSRQEWISAGGDPAALLADRYIMGVSSAAKKAYGEIKDAGTNIDQGGPLLENWGKGFAASSEFLLRGLLGPFGGESIQAWGEDLNAKNFSGATGDVVATLFNALLLKGASPLSETGKANKIAYAADMSKGLEELKTVLPDIEQASKGKPPLTLEELESTVNAAKDHMNLESGLAMQPIRDTPVSATSIAQRIRSRISPDMAMTAEGKQIESSLRNMATDFEREGWTYGKLDALRMRWGAELKGYWNMNPADKTGYLKAHPEVAGMAEAVGAIKEDIYPAMDRAVGKPAGYFEGLKARQSTLIDLQRELAGTVDKLQTETAKSKGAPRFSERNLSTYVAGTGTPHPGFSLHRLRLFRENPLGKANASIKRAFSGSPKAQAAAGSLPVRKLLEQVGAKPETKDKRKKPGEQIRDLNKLSTNPNLPVGVAP